MTTKSCDDCLNCRCICKKCKGNLKLCDKNAPNSSSSCEYALWIKEEFCFTSTSTVTNILKEKINYGS